jgi:hypothetical protein
MNAALLNLEQDDWSSVVGPTINPLSPSAYKAVNTKSELRLYVIGAPDAGWLAKHVAPFVQVPAITFRYDLDPDTATASNAQVIETDSKFTDAAGWTYDGSCQLNLAEGGMWQIANAAGAWVDTGIKSGIVPERWTPIEIVYALDFVNRAISVQSISSDGVLESVPAALQSVPAKQVGWEPNQIVTQLQQVLNSTGSAYSVGFRNISYIWPMTSTAAANEQLDSPGRR